MQYRSCVSAFESHAAPMQWMRSVLVGDDAPRSAVAFAMHASTQLE